MLIGMKPAGEAFVATHKKSQTLQKRFDTPSSGTFSSPSGAWYGVFGSLILVGMSSAFIFSFFSRFSARHKTS